MAKTAGTHLNSMMKRSSNFHFYEFSEFDGRLSPLTKNEANLLISGLKDNSFATSHYFKLDALPVRDDVKYVSIIRDPVKRVISEFNYKRMRNLQKNSDYKSTCKTNSFEEWWNEEQQLWLKHNPDEEHFSWQKNWQYYCLKEYKKRFDITILRSESLYNDFVKSELNTIVDLSYINHLMFRYGRSNQTFRWNRFDTNNRYKINKEEINLILQNNQKDYELFEFFR